MNDLNCTLHLPGVCPVLCNGHGDYIDGACSCHPGWKGRECGLRHEECEVQDCSGRGQCLEGKCKCMQGFTGEHCQKGENVVKSRNVYGICPWYCC